MRAVMFFLLGAVTALVAAAAWMPRPAWIELLDHVRNGATAAYRESNLGDGVLGGPSLQRDWSALDAPDAMGGGVSGKLRLVHGREILTISPETVAKTCMEAKGGDSFLNKGLASYQIFLKPEAKALYLENLARFMEEKDRLSDIFALSGDSLLQNQAFSPAFSIEPHKAQGPEKNDFSISAWEPLLEEVERLAVNLNGGKALEECENIGLAKPLPINASKKSAAGIFLFV